LGVALIWSIVLLVAACLVPTYSSTSVSSDGVVTHGSETLVGDNGLGVLPVVAAPLLLTCLVAAALWRRGTRPGAGALAWTATGLLIAFNLVALMSIGVFVLPVTVALTLACATRKEQIEPVWLGDHTP
jgi:hypothetical protein